MAKRLCICTKVTVDVKTQSGLLQLTQHFGPCLERVLEELYIRELRMTWAAFTKHSATICCTRPLLVSDISTNASPLIMTGNPLQCHIQCVSWQTRLILSKDDF